MRGIQRGPVARTASFLLAPGGSLLLPLNYRSLADPPRSTTEPCLQRVGTPLSSRTTSGCSTPTPPNLLYPRAYPCIYALASRWVSIGIQVTPSFGYLFSVSTPPT